MPGATCISADLGKSDGGSAFKKFSLRSLVGSSGDPLIELLTFFHLSWTSQISYFIPQRLQARPPAAQVPRRCHLDNSPISRRSPARARREQESQRGSRDRPPIQSWSRRSEASSA